MANKEQEVICKSVFKNDNLKIRKDEYLIKWIELINIQEKYRKIKP